MAFFTDNALFGLNIIGILGLAFIYFNTLNQSLSKKNEKYNKLTYLITITSVSASLILYGLALYYFTVFPGFGPMFLIMTTLFVASLQLIATSLSQWKVANTREYVSGGSDNKIPFHKVTSLIISIILPILFIFIFIPILIKYFNVSPVPSKLSFLDKFLINPQQLLFSLIPILLSFSLYTSTQSFTNLRNLTNFYA
jgi:hypothetical protein